mgnify:FL=1
MYLARCLVPTVSVILVLWDVICWNYGHRPLKFYDGGMLADAQRIAMSIFTPAGANNQGFLNVTNAFTWIEQHDQDAVAWLLDLQSPKYPKDVDVQMAEQGAILFHTKDLWKKETPSLRAPKAGTVPVQVAMEPIHRVLFMFRITWMILPWKVSQDMSFPAT